MTEYRVEFNGFQQLCIYYILFAHIFVFLFFVSTFLSKCSYPDWKFNLLLLWGKGPAGVSAFDVIVHSSQFCDRKDDGADPGESGKEGLAAGGAFL